MRKRPLHPAAKRPRASIATHTDWYRITGPGVTNGPDADTTVIDIYEAIGGWFGLGADEFVKDLRTVTTSNIELHINSEGGDVWDAIAIYNALLQHPADVHAIVDSLAASAASFVAMAGDRISAARNSQIMIHDALGVAIGNAVDLREYADFLDRMSDEIASIYADRTEDDTAVWRERMRAETWYNAAEAEEVGLVDDVLGRDGKPVDNRKLAGFHYAGRNAAPDPTAPATDTATPSHQTSTVEDTWDASTQQGRLPSPMSLATAKAMYGWYDPDRVEDGKIVKAGCKLPHHEVSDAGTPGAANLAGVRNALSRLPNSDIPTAEHDAIRSHLQGHLDAARGDDSAPPGTRLSGLLARTDALLAGRDPDEKADPLQVARIDGQLAARSEIEQIEAERALRGAVQARQAAEKAADEAADRLAEVNR